MGNSEQSFLEGVDSGAIIFIFWLGPGKIGFVFQGVFEGCRFWMNREPVKLGVITVWSRLIVCTTVRD